MEQPSPQDCLPQGHAILLRHPAGRDIFGADQRNQPVNLEAGESIVATGARRLRRQALSPDIPAHVVTDFQQDFAFYFLLRQPAIADQFPALLQDHSPQPVSVVRVAQAVARDPLLDPRAIVGRGIVAHGFAIGEHTGKGIDIFWNEFTKHEARSFENHHETFWLAGRGGCRYVVGRSEYNLFRWRPRTLKSCATRFATTNTSITFSMLPRYPTPSSTG